MILLRSWLQPWPTTPAQVSPPSTLPTTHWRTEVPVSAPIPSDRACYHVTNGSSHSCPMSFFFFKVHDSPQAVWQRRQSRLTWPRSPSAATLNFLSPPYFVFYQKASQSIRGTFIKHTFHQILKQLQVEVVTQEFPISSSCASDLLFSARRYFLPGCSVCQTSHGAQAFELLQNFIVAQRFVLMYLILSFRNLCMVDAVYLGQTVFRSYQKL